MRRLLPTLASALLALAALLHPVPVAAAEPEAARLGAAWLGAQTRDTDDVGALVDALLAWGAVDDLPAAVDARDALNRVLDGARDYAAEAPESAARLAILAAALEDDPRSFAGLDLVEIVRSAIAEDGTFGAEPGAAASGLAVLALSRSGEQVPANLVDRLLASAGEDGGWGATDGDTSDAVGTGTAILALLTIDSEEAAAARDAGVQWAIDNTEEDGSWGGDFPLVPTATMASALAAAGADADGAVAWLASRQDAATGAFPEAGEGAEAVSATAAAVLGLAGSSLLVVTGFDGAEDPWRVDGTVPFPALLVVGVAALVGGALLAWLPARRRPDATEGDEADAPGAPPEPPSPRAPTAS